MEQIIGHRPSSHHPACPSGVIRIAQWSVPEQRDPLRYFVSKHTMLPYFMAFEPPITMSKCLAVLRSSPRACITEVLRPASLRIGAPGFLRLCQACVKQDTHAFGECIWHISHQLPGVFHCHEHAEPLLSSRIPFSTEKFPRFLTPASQEVQASLQIAESPFYGLRLERAVSSRSQRLLRDDSAESPWGPVTTYRRALMHFGFGGRRDELRMAAFEEDFGKWLRRHKCNSEKIGHGRWWLRLITAVPGRSTPLQHLVFGQYVREKKRRSLAAEPDLFGF